MEISKNFIQYRTANCWWGGEMPHARMPRAILAHATLAHWYKISCVCCILQKWRIVIFSSQNVIMAHCYSFIL
jgi:hypothetical protein